MRHPSLNPGYQIERELCDLYQIPVLDIALLVLTPLSIDEAKTILCDGCFTADLA